MADQDIHVVRVDKGGATDPVAIPAKAGDVVHWVPRTTTVKVKVKFKNGKTPFDLDEFPTTPKAGEIVTKEVLSGAALGNYEYNASGSRRAQRGDPIIIVRDSRRRKAKKKGPKNVARKK